ncbi:hypothetical protein I3843_07G121100 [Carya illinoinensis]|nr:hypothetical protein I3843_07G121100 [Carya illinoinensis]
MVSFGLPAFHKSADKPASHWTCNSALKPHVWV